MRLDSTTVNSLRGVASSPLIEARSAKKPVRRRPRRQPDEINPQCAELEIRGLVLSDRAGLLSCKSKCVARDAVDKYSEGV